MKIANKVLAVVMAVAMIACLSAMAFAAIAPANAKMELVLDGTDVKLYAKDSIGLASANVTLKFDPAVVTKVRVTSGADAKNVNADNFENNSFSSENNAADVANVSYGFYFKEFLWDAAKFAAEDLSGEANINATNFHVATFKLTLAEGKTAEDVVVEISAAADFANAAGEKEAIASFPCVGIEKVVPPSTEPTTTEAPSTQAPTTQCKPETTTNKEAGVPAGDTGVLAIAAGVVAIAGAAFVVSKKRK